MRATSHNEASTINSNIKGVYSKLPGFRVQWLHLNRDGTKSAHRLHSVKTHLALLPLILSSSEARSPVLCCRWPAQWSRVYAISLSLVPPKCKMAPQARSEWLSGYATNLANVTFPEMSKKSVALLWPHRLHPLPAPDVIMKIHFPAASGARWKLCVWLAQGSN